MAMFWMFWSGVDPSCDQTAAGDCFAGVADSDICDFKLPDSPMRPSNYGVGIAAFASFEYALSTELESTAVAT